MLGYSILGYGYGLNLHTTHKKNFVETNPIEITVNWEWVHA